MNNEILVYLHNGTLYSNEKEKSRHLQNIDLSHKNYGEQKKPDTKEYDIIPSIFILFM